MRYFLHLGFNGSKYHGWQFQPEVVTVQETIETELKRIFKQKITAFGCGRTDAGVHASQYYAHINLDQSLDFDLKFRLNKNLPDDISVYQVLEVTKDQHARYDATFRTYDYFIHLTKDALLSNCSSFYQLDKLNLDAMNKAVKLVLRQQDFKALCRRPHIYKHTLCEVTNAALFTNKATDRLRFTITANRFLHGMIRIIVYYLLQIGTGRLSIVEFDKILQGERNEKRKRLAKPNGLYLSRIEYPYFENEPRHHPGGSLLLDLEP
ncbi:MAG: tRNA pseudouridine(38-40) synthase TruA [Flavobacteriales bacterium]|nr:tRNA pseudouridine(38-40) synthase TruA [Flavobacteriales bacterium]